MFKFGFSRNEEEVERVETEKSTINWIPASNVNLSISEIERNYEPSDYTTQLIFPGCELKLIRSDKVLHDLQEDNCAAVIEAESKHSDLIPAKYEGGFKIWECTYDLARYISEENIDLEMKSILDLGCGAGIIGLVALLRNSIVHFQDYNVEVIKSVTIPNVTLNIENPEIALERCKFFCGDWESFTKMANSNSDNERTKYDLIFTSETIYNPDNHQKLYNVFKQRLKTNGIGFVAGKSYYFGVGGGMKQFQCLIEEDGAFDVRTVWKSKDGLQREILQITRKSI